MNTNEIIKALGCCIVHLPERCKACPYNDLNTENCVVCLMSDAREIIKQQQAEIERLNKCREINVSSIATLHQKLKTAKAEAIKEFAERVKYEFCPDCDYSTNEIRGTLNYLVKEMIEKGGEG